MSGGAAQTGGLYLASDYNVPGDGQTDAAPALRLFLAIVAAAGGGVAQLVSGQTYLLKSTVVVPSSTNGIELITPTGTKILAAAGLNADILQATGVTNFQMSGGGIIDGNRANQTAGNGITLTNCVEPLITDVVVQNCYQDGISLSGCSRPLLNAFAITNGRHGVYIGGASTAATGVVIARDNGQRVTGSGVAFDGASTDSNLQVAATDTRVGGAKTQQYGVLEVAASGCDRNVILGALGGNATGTSSLIGASSKQVDQSSVLTGAAPTASAEGDAATVGAAGTAARADHLHGREAFGGAAVTQAFGDAAAAGAATTPSRSDHKHGMPAAPTAPALVKIAEVGPLGSSQAALDFSSIPASYRNLRLVISGRITSGNDIAVSVQFNADTAGNYDFERLNAASTTVASSEGIAATSAAIGQFSGLANGGGQIELTLGNYAGTTLQKSGRSVGGHKDVNSSGNVIVEEYAIFWRSTAAINAIHIILASSSFEVGTVASLYGET